MNKSALSASMTVETVLQQWPETVTVFQAFKVACVGCVMASFDTVADVARIYELDLGELMCALQDEVSFNRERI